MPSIPAVKRSGAGRPPALIAPHAQILQEAAKLFARRGYENSSIADLAGALGISKVGIYHYFATKQDIYGAIVSEVLQNLYTVVSQAVEHEVLPDEQLRCFMVTHALYFEAHHEAFVTMLIGYSGMVLPECADAVRLRDAYEKLLRDILERGVRQGMVRDVNIASTGRAVLTMLNWMVRWYKPGQQESAEAIAVGYFDLLWCSLQS
jgi:TetR/AcrR family transcriptional regulator, cholesterol catabolism regulator